MADGLRDRLAKGLDAFAKGFGAAVEDVRHRFEEFAWGRVVTPSQQANGLDSAGEQSLAEKSGWPLGRDTQAHRASEPGWHGRCFAQDESRTTDPADHFREPPEQDRGLER